jgi:hypothetical protein
MLCRLDETKLFFACRRLHTPQWDWWHRLKRKLYHSLFSKMKEAGDLVDNAAQPLYLQEHVVPLLRGYARVDTSEAAARKFVLSLLWHCGGMPTSPPLVYLLTKYTFRWFSPMYALLACSNHSLTK